MNNAEVKRDKTLKLILNFWENKIKISTPTKSAIYEPLENVKSKLISDTNNKNELSTVQPLSIYYQVNNEKLSNDFYGWWGSMSIISHIIKILCLSSGSVILRFHKPFDSKDFSNRKELAIAVESIISKDISNQILNN